ncbi:MAG: hypothetical protein ACO2ZM_04465 [Francisellaceae bacterium]
MSRIQQNIIYAGILIAIIGFFWFIVPKQPAIAHGVYLPQTTVKYKPITPDQVAVTMGGDFRFFINKPTSGPYGNPAGIIHSMVYYTKNSELDAAYRMNLVEVKKLAAEHGMNEIITNCFAPSNPSATGGAQCYAYAYSDDR